MFIAIDTTTHETLAEARTASELAQIIADEFGNDAPRYWVAPAPKLVRAARKVREWEWK
jgi:hypothetical protein